MFEISSIMRDTGEVQESQEVFEQGVSASQRNEGEPIRVQRKLAGTLEIPPEVLYCLLAFIILGTNGEAALYLPDQFPLLSRSVSPNDQEIVRLPTEMLRLQANLL